MCTFTSMRKQILLLATCLVITTLQACQESASNMQYIQQMKDSILKTYPTVNSVTIEVNEGTVLNIALGDAHLYNAADTTRQRVGNELGNMALRLFPKTTMLDKGMLMVTKDETNTSINPAGSKSSGINLDSLRQHSK